MPDLTYAGLVAGGWRSLDFELFRHGVTVHWMARGATGEPSVAILKYLPGARIPRHRHAGLETILILDGIQSDEKGDYATGSYILNPKGSEHSVWTDMGCVVLIQWDLPVEILEQEHSRD
jgi:anti-sigma factor ChrR (cupin superfamily)